MWDLIKGDESDVGNIDFELQGNKGVFFFFFFFFKFFIVLKYKTKQSTVKSLEPGDLLCWDLD